MKIATRLSLLFALFVSLGVTASAGEDGLTQRVSLAPGGAQGNGASGTGPVHAVSMTPDARYITFVALATNLVTPDTNNQFDVFLLDRNSGSISMMNLGPAGVQANDQCYLPRISANGRFVGFNGYATNLVAGDTNGFNDVFVRDVVTGITERVSVSSDEVQGNLPSDNASVSEDGHYVAFWSGANNLVPGDGNNAGDIFVRDRFAGRTLVMTILPTGLQANLNSFHPWINGAGTHVAFASFATNLVGGDTNGVPDLFLANIISGAVARVGQPSGGQSNGASVWPTLSHDAGFIAFESEATNLVSGDTNGVQDVFVQNLTTGSITRVSVDSSGVQGNGASEHAWISATGRYVAFTSEASNLVPDDNNNKQDVFLRDLQTGVTTRVSHSMGALGNGNGLSFYPSVSEDGLEVAFASQAGNLVPGDSNSTSDVFVRSWPTPPVIFCTGNYPFAPCACANTSTAAFPGGCRNSTTFGAYMAWTGTTSASSDSLAVSVVDMPGSKPGLLFAGTTELNGGQGVTFGDGLRCTGGTITRLGVELSNPTGVASWAPGLGAQVGWSAGETRYLQGWYRDIPGPCGSGFNTSSALRLEIFP